ncbi:hypothetical protein GGER_10150 [Serratia rubidaea]
MISKENNEISSNYHDLPGYVHGAKIIQVALTKTPIDNISDVVYETVKKLVLSDNCICLFLFLVPTF